MRTLLTLIALCALTASTAFAAPVTFTFDESRVSLNPNPLGTTGSVSSIVSSNGEYALYSQYNGFYGNHFHISSCSTCGNAANNHGNFETGHHRTQGYYLARTDGGLFNLESFDLLGTGQQVSLNLADPSEFNGSFNTYSAHSGWQLFAGTNAFGTTTTITLDNAYHDISGVFIGSGQLAGSSNHRFWLDNITVDNMSEPVPEPGTMLLMGSGLASMLGYGWRKRGQQSA